MEQTQFVPGSQELLRPKKSIRDAFHNEDVVRRPHLDVAILWSTDLEDDGEAITQKHVSSQHLWEVAENGHQLPVRVPTLDHFLLMVPGGYDMGRWTSMERWT